MALLLPAFRPDLRNPGLEVPPSPRPWAQWNKFTVVELACRRTFDFFASHLAPGSHVVDVGSGNGYLALELARIGHHVVGIDPGEEAIAVAERALSENSDDMLGRLSYVKSGFWEWEPREKLDAILFNRSLHHVPLDGIGERCHELLRDGGNVICSDFAADGVDARWKAWISSKAKVGDLDAHGHDLSAMLGELRGQFHERHYSSEPHLFVVVANQALHDDWQTTKRLYDEELELLNKQHYLPVGWRWVGLKR